MKAFAIVAAAAAAPAAFGDLLWDNGSFATGTTNSAGASAPAGTQWSEVQHTAQGSNGTISVGLNYTLTGATGPNRLSDDFTVTGPGWNIDQIVVYGSRTGMALTEQFTTGVVQIWNGRPGDAGSTVVAGDLTTNRFVSNQFTNIYRVGFGSNSTTRPVQAVTLSLQATLGPGTYWVEYGLTGSGAGSIQTPLVTIPGQLTTADANARFYTSFQYFNLIDSNSSVPLAAPFQVLGSPVPEPATVAALGLGALALIRRRRIARR